MKNYFSSNLYYLRTTRKLSQSDIGNQIDKGHTTIGNWENGKGGPDVFELAKLSQFFEISTDDIIFSDLEKGNLIEKKADLKTEQKGNLKGNAIGNLNTKKEANYGDIEDPAPWVLQEGIKTDNKAIVMPRVVTIDTKGEENAVFVPVRARAGYLMGYGDAEFIGTLPAFKIIGDRNKSYRIFEVDGNSMFPALHDKDTVDAYWIKLSEIRDDRIHVILTKNDGVLIKRVINRFSEGHLVCKSDNNDKGEYPPIILPIHDVLEVWYVEKATSHNLAKPGEIYKRMIDLEANVALLMHRAGLLNLPQNPPKMEGN